MIFELIPVNSEYGCHSVELIGIEYIDAECRVFSVQIK